MKYVIITGDTFSDKEQKIYQLVNALSKLISKNQQLNVFSSIETIEECGFVSLKYAEDTQLYKQDEIDYDKISQDIDQIFPNSYTNLIDYFNNNTLFRLEDIIPMSSITDAEYQDVLLGIINNASNATLVSKLLI